MIPAILAKIGVPVLASILSEALGKVDSPATKSASEVLKNLSLDEQQTQEVNRHAETMAQIAITQNTSALKEINETIRHEIASEDKYVRHMRPTFGYLMAITWAAQMLGLAYVIIFDPTRAGEVMTGMSHMTGIWGIGLSVLGIYVYKRSEDKKLG